MSTELANMVDKNISGFITCYITNSGELQQSIRAKMTGMTMLERCGVGNNSKGVEYRLLRRMHGRKMDGVQRPGAITPGDHVPGSKILHR
jgi:hypothetical protein